MKGENDASTLMKWVIKNNVSSTIFMPYVWQGKTLTLEGLIEIYKQLYWSIYDDGVVTFVKTNGGPIIYFNCYDIFGENLPENLPNPTFPDLFVKFEGTFTNVFDFMKEWEEKQHSSHEEWFQWYLHKLFPETEND
jgi:hypothetical protein